jgi:hypothetical protein
VTVCDFSSVATCYAELEWPGSTRSGHADYLGGECGLTHEYQTSETRPGGEVVTMYFPPSVTAAAIEQCLVKLFPAEVERFYGLNN